jgi:chaperonin GroES
MTIKPIGNRAVVELLKTQTTHSGIIIATEEKNEQQIGKIIAIGNGIDSEEGNITKIGLNIGDIVILSRYGGDEISNEQNSDVTYKIVNLKDILAIKSN